MDAELVEVVDGVLVEEDEEPQAYPVIRPSPPVQTAVAAAAGVAVGAATFALLRRRVRRAAVEAIQRERPPLRLSGTYLVTIRPLR